ncbi:phosphorylase [Acinetobacter johnsonii]|uniref:phosphorylase family protein n=1 Tax=Acinetobacter johnsonii TaxID=40214 RepID=UPI0032B3D921
MLKILLVEDLIQKKAEIVEVIQEKFRGKAFHIDYATDVVTAKNFISSSFYDFVILDLNLPRRVVNRAENNVGIEVIQFIETNPRAISPKFIACLTAYTIEPDFIKNYPLCHFVHYSSTNSEWKELITKICSYLERTHSIPLRKDKKSFHYDVLIVTAITEEFDAVISFLKTEDEWEYKRIMGDAQKYAVNTVNTEFGTLNIVLTQSSQMGMAAAAVSATKAIEFFCPQIILMAGICAGVKGKTNFGDIVVADPSFDSGSGKWKVNEDGDLIFHPAHYHLRIDVEIKRICDEISADRNLLTNIYQGFNLPVTRPNVIPKVLVEANASGGSVLQSTVKMAEIVDTHKNLVGLEMEAYAVYLAASNSRQPQPKFISAKSVCDFGTEDKGDAVHQYASYTSVAFINEFLQRAEFLNEHLVNKSYELEY